MIGLTGALVALAAVLATVLVLGVRPPARRLARAAAAWRADVDVRVDRLRALRRARRGAAASSSPGGHGRHRRVDGAP